MAPPSRGRHLAVAVLTVLGWFAAVDVGFAVLTAGPLYGSASDCMVLCPDRRGTLLLSFAVTAPAVVLGLVVALPAAVLLAKRVNGVKAGTLAALIGVVAGTCGLIAGYDMSGA